MNRLLLTALLLILACSGEPAPPPAPPGAAGGSAQGGASSGGAAGSPQGASGQPTAGGDGGGGAAPGGQGGDGGSGASNGGCEVSTFPPQLNAYPITVGTEKAWVHDEKFSSGYFLTFDQFGEGMGESPRKIHIFLPRNYPEGCARYPVLYMNDGVTAFWPGGPGNKSWEVAQGLTKVYEGGKVSPLIVVAIHAINRNVEYSHTEWSPGEPCCGVEGYADYVGDRVKGFVDAHFRTKAGPEDTAILGSSRGGLCSFLLATLRPDRFRKAASLSPSFWLGLDPVFGGDFAGGPLAGSKLLAMAAPTLDNPALRPRLWIDWGLVHTGGFHNEVIEAAATKRGKEMVALLQKSYGYVEGVNLFWQEDPIGEHDEVSWARRFPAVIEALYAGAP